MRQPNRRHVLAGLAAATATALLGGRAGARPPAPETVAPLGDDFLWGVAASGFQSEGNAPDSNWVRYIAVGKTEDPYLDSIDFYGRFRSDIGLAAQLGVRVYRIGIEWARLQPRPGEWDPAGFRFYDNVIAAIEAAGMRPMLTLDHWVYPGWEVDRGGCAIRRWWTTGWPTRARSSIAMPPTIRCGSLSTSPRCMS